MALNIPVAPSQQAERLVETYIYAEDISALRLVRAINDTTVQKANRNSFIDSQVLGITLQAGTTGSTQEVLLAGKLEDNSFNFPVNDPLYLTLDGEITNVAPGLGFQTIIGKSLGIGAIFINIREPIEII